VTIAGRLHLRLGVTIASANLVTKLVITTFWYIFDNGK